MPADDGHVQPNDSDLRLPHIDRCPNCQRWVAARRTLWSPASMASVAKVVRQIARGGFGRVEEVRLDDGTRAARKVFDPSPRMNLAGPELAKAQLRFANEVRMQRELATHGGFPVLFDALGETPPWFVMPIAERSYETQIADDRAAGNVSHGPLLDILSALEAMHRLDFVHRDLKPANALFLDKRWRLSDFGLAMNPTGSMTTRLTSTGSGWGSVPYMAPEQTTNFKRVRPTADIYAFGCILHDLVDGGMRVPFGTHSAAGPFAAIIRKCTEQDPGKRFKNVSALRSMLVEVLNAGAGSSQRTKEETDWIAALPSLATWTAAQLGEFLSHVEKTAVGFEHGAVGTVSEDHLGQLVAKCDADEWPRLGHAYCEWATGSFTWSFCDVVVGRLERIFAEPKSELDLRVAAVNSMAHLGHTHNRWHVMGRLLHLADGTLDDRVAERVAIEIRARDLTETFTHCATAINHEVTAYHPRIAAAATGF